MSQGGERPHERAILLIDEIGKMECFSPRFVQAVRTVLDGPMPIVATAALSGPGFIADVKRRPNVELLEVTAQNRDGLPGQLAERISRWIGAASARNPPTSTNGKVTHR